MGRSRWSIAELGERGPDAAELAVWVGEARGRTFALVDDLTDEQLLGPALPIVNPLLWEIGHVAWFQERWVLRDGGRRPSLWSRADELYDSSAVAHDTRWALPLLDRAETYDYLRAVRDGVLDLLAEGEPDPARRYFVELAVFHEDMHCEAFTYTRQTLGYAAPGGEGAALRTAAVSTPCGGDVELGGGTYRLGAEADGRFVFDNEKWAHPVEIPPFRIARTAVRQEEFAAFVDDGGYRRAELWTEEGWRWRREAGAEAPCHWRRVDDAWQRRDFDRWVPLEAERAMVHVNWHEASAWCRWAGRRLPSEAEWELAASVEPNGGRRRFPWGDDVPGAARANLDGRAGGCVDVAALPAGDAPSGCRQMIGNVWEWTADRFLPYPGFSADPYADYSQPWFETHRVLRGGAWPTRSRLIRNTWRNFYTPDRRDVWAGFRTCAR